MAETQRTKPFSVEAEQSVLGAVLIDPEAISKVSAVLHGSDFYIPEHGEIFDAMNEIFIKDKAIDMVTLVETLVSRGIYSKEDCVRYVKVIAETVPSAANVMDYAKIVRDKAVLRSLIDASDEISENAYSARGDVQMILDDAEQKIFDLSRTSDTKQFVTIREALYQAISQLDELRKNPDAAAGERTGYGDLDKYLVGLVPGDLVIIGARPGMGKTSFAMNIATNIAKRSKKTVCVFSLEMTVSQLASRMLSSEALVDSMSIRSGKISTGDYDQLAKAASELSECNIMLDDTSNVTVTQMKAKLRRQKNLGLVVVDYLQLMHSDVNRKDGNRVLEVGDISRGLKLMAKDLGVPIICCAQLSRATEKNGESRRPTLSDLRDSGAIEQDADIVMFLHGDYAKGEQTSNEAECVIAKNRHGSCDVVKLSWLGKYTKFLSLETNRDMPE